MKSALIEAKNEENVGVSELVQMDLGSGVGRIKLKPRDGIFYEVLSGICNIEVSSENDLLSIIKDLTFLYL